MLIYEEKNENPLKNRILFDSSTPSKVKYFSGNHYHCVRNNEIAEVSVQHYSLPIIFDT